VPKNTLLHSPKPKRGLLPAYPLASLKVRRVRPVFSAAAADRRRRIKRKFVRGTSFFKMKLQYRLLFSDFNRQIFLKIRHFNNQRTVAGGKFALFYLAS
jgi:hypothetical protein